MRALLRVPQQGAGEPARTRSSGRAGPGEFPHFHGAFAEYYYLRPGGALFKVPDELPDELVAR